MKLHLIWPLFLVLSGTVNAQTDSIKQSLSSHILIKALDSISNGLKDKGAADIISFNVFRYVNPYGVVIWKELSRFKGIKICSKKNVIEKRNIKSSIVNSFVNSFIARSECDVVEILKGGKKTYISHDFFLYFGRQIGATRDEIYFAYSTYLSYKDSCVKGLKYLISL